MLNPNSFKNISSILQNIGTRSGIRGYSSEGQREWRFLENDGGILSPIYKLIENVLKCTSCEKLFYGRENYDAHQCTSATNEPTQEFGWVLPCPGNSLNICWKI